MNLLIGFGKKSGFLRLFCACLGLCLAASAQALEEFKLHLDQLAQGSLRLTDLNLSLQIIDAQHLHLQVQAAQLHLPGFVQPLRKIKLSCARLEDSPTQLRCDDAQLYTPDLLDSRARNIRWRYQKASGALEINAPRLVIAGLRLSFNFSTTKGWQLSAPAQTLPAKALFQRAQAFFNLLPGWTLEGAVKIKHLQVGTQPKQMFGFKTDLSSENFNFSNAAGTQVGEKLALDVQVQATSTPTTWEFDPQISLRAGELYLSPLYMQVQQSVQLNTSFSWNGAQHVVRISQLDYQHADFFRVQGNLSLGFQPTLHVQTAQLKLPRCDLAKVQHSYLQTWLQDQGWGELHSSGALDGELHWQAKDSHAQITLQPISLTTPSGGINGLTGTLHWHSQQARATHLHWDKLHWKAFDIPARQLNLRLQGDGGTLLSPLEVPLFDGALHLTQLGFDKLSSSEPELSLSGRIEPISMIQISQALGLPPLGGQLAAMIPKIFYHKHQLEMDGALLLQVFGGDIVIHRLSLQDPLGALPLLNAAIDIQRLDLQTLTQFFEFGEISGRLSGQVENLQLAHWQPVQFDAYVSTPDGESGGRISQKAVRNLSSLGGGGMADALSRGVLSFFESFSYARLGVGCRLRNKVCTMRGVATAENGYYLVQGGGLPRIDVKGFNPQVDWDVLLDRLANVTQLGTPVIR